MSVLYETVSAVHQFVRHLLAQPLESFQASHESPYCFLKVLQSETLPDLRRCCCQLPYTHIYIYEYGYVYFSIFISIYLYL